MKNRQAVRFGWEARVAYARNSVALRDVNLRFCVKTFDKPEEACLELQKKRQFIA